MGNSNKILARFLVLLFLVSLFAFQDVLAQTAESVFDHFDFDYIGSQDFGVPFNITIRAKDQYNQTLSSYNGSITLSASLIITNTNYPQSFGSTGAFINGVWTGEVTLSKGGGTTYFFINVAGKNYYSNRFFTSGPLLPLELDHFRFDNIGDPQNVGVPFLIRITAEDQYNDTFTSYNGTNTWSALLVVHENLYNAGQGVTGAFVNGFWSGEITLTRAGDQNWWYGSTSISTVGDGKYGRSNPIGVWDLTAKPTPTKTQTPAPSEPPAPSASPTSSPTPTPSISEFSWLIILPLFLSILSIVVLVRKRKVSWTK